MSLSAESAVERFLDETTCQRANNRRCFFRRIRKCAVESRCEDDRVEDDPALLTIDEDTKRWSVVTDDEKD